MIRLFQKVLPWAVVLGAAALAIFYLWKVVPAPAPSTLAEFNSCLEQKEQSDAAAKRVVDMTDVEACEKSQADSLDGLVKAPIEDMKWMLEMIGALAGFFVIAQGAAAYFSAVVYSDQADKALERIEGVYKGLSARYPIFSDLERQRQEASSLLDDKIAGFAHLRDARSTEALRSDIKKRLYREMEVPHRQWVLSLESFASIDVFPGPSGGSGWSESLRRYALFYQSKFLYEQSVGHPSFGDLERAEAYLRKAASLSSGDFTFLNDLGVLCMDIHGEIAKAASGAERGDRHREEACEIFEKSLRMEPKQQRAYYNLAVIHSESTPQREGYLLAEKELTLALQQRNWQQYPPVDAVKALLFYNLGCYQGWLIGSGQWPMDRVPDCLENLRRAAGLAGRTGIENIGRDTVERDFGWEREGSEGDLTALYRKADQNLQGQLTGIRGDLLNPTQSPQPRRTRFEEAIQRIAKLISTGRRR